MKDSLDQIDQRVGSKLGARWIVAPSAIERFGQSEGHHGGHVPQRVAQPLSVAEVQLVVGSSNDLGIPIVPYGAGTSLEGNAEAVSGGIVLDLSRMTKIAEVHAEDLLVVVEPGVTREQLNSHLRDTGYFFPVDPGANATLGGMIATRASGTNAVRYGTMRENTLALDIVLADGTLIKTGSRARKSSAGYDLTHLFVGSEGTLGVIVGATLRIHGQPETIVSAIWPFQTLKGAVETVIATIQLGIPVARMELLDPCAIRACNAYSGMDMPQLPTLFLEFHGSPLTVEEHLSQVREIGTSLGGGELISSTEPAIRRDLWRARHAALPAARALIPGAKVWVTDVCVPISHLGEAIADAQACIAREGLVAPILGHVGDGNFHVFLILPQGDEEAFARASRVNESLVALAIALGGTSTGEHGIGIGKREALLTEHGSDAVGLMRRVKALLDPAGILNPQKIFLPD